MVDIVVLGATGFTGKLITRYLHVHRERDTFSFAIAGRSKAKLSELVADLGLDSSVQIFTVDVTDEAQVETVVKKAKVVINTVGPFWRWGKPVVKACARHGVHYVDLTGEAAFVSDIIHEFDYLASKSHAILVPSCGFDSVPSDALVYLAARTLRGVTDADADNFGIASSHTRYTASGGISGGTLSTALMMLEDLPPGKLAAVSKPYALSPISVEPSALPRALARKSRFLYKLPFVTKGGRWGFPFPLAPHNISTVQRTWALHELYRPKPSHDGLDVKAGALPAYGHGGFSYTESWGASGPISAFLCGLAFALGGAALVLFPPVRWLFKWLATSPGKGPSDESLAKGWINLRNITVSTPLPTTSRPVVVETTVRGRGDPGYTLTAIMISEAALALLTPSKLPALARQGGVLTPMSAFGDVLIRRLSASGRFEFESEALEKSA